MTTDRLRFPTLVIFLIYLSAIFLPYHSTCYVACYVTNQPVNPVSSTLHQIEWLVLALGPWLIWTHRVDSRIREGLASFCRNINELDSFILQPIHYFSVSAGVLEWIIYAAAFALDLNFLWFFRRH